MSTRTKRWLRRGAIAAGVMVLALGGIMVGGYLWVSTPTAGPHIGRYSSPRKALLVVDVQEDFTGPAKPVFPDHARLVSELNRLLDASPRLGLLPVTIRQIVPNNLLGRLSSGGLAIEGTAGVLNDARLHRLNGAADFTKQRSDAFSNPALDQWLRAHEVDEVYVVGLDAKYCVNRTARGALARGYRVKIIREAVTTASGTSLDELLERLRTEGAEIVNLADLGV